MHSVARDAFLAGLDEPTRAIVAAVADAVEGAGALDVDIRWKRLTYAVNSDFHHWICGIGTTKRGVVLQLHFGGLLEDPDQRLVAGESRFLRTLTFCEPASVEAELVRGFVRAAVARLPFFRANWKAIQAGAVLPR